MKSSFSLFIVLIFCLTLSGCVLLGLVEIEGGLAAAAEVGEIGTLAVESSAITEVASTADLLSFAPEAEVITEFRTIIRSDVSIDAYTLLKNHLPPVEFDVIEGIVRNEGSVNSLLSKVRVARVGTASPRLYIRVAENQGVEFAEVTSNRTIRLLRSGRAFRLPGKIYTTNSNSVYLKDIQNYKVLAHVNPHQVILVLDELPINGNLQVRVGANTGLIAMASLIAVSHKKYIGASSFNKYNYRSVECRKCHGQGRFNCKICLGSGKLLCPLCKGAMYFICTHCSGSGVQNCDNCKGYGSYDCTNCGGSGRIGNAYCNKCEGRGKLYCSVCQGKGTTVCSVCQGRERTLCTRCGGSTKISCNNCNGYGYFICDICNGSGVTWVAYR